MRYAGTQLRDAAVRNPDHLAGRFVGGAYEWVGQIPGLRGIATSFYRSKFPGSLEYHVVRTKYFDKWFLSAAERDGSEIVIIGAGLDSRAYRFSEQAQKIRIFEVDHPDTQDFKRDRLRHCGIHQPDNLAFAAADLEKDDLWAVLRHAGYSGTSRVLFLLEGLSMFIDRETFLPLLASLPSNCGVDSRVVFDYVCNAALDGDDEIYGLSQIRAYVERGGEPWRFGLDPTSAKAELQALGLTDVVILEKDQLDCQFLQTSSGALLERGMVGFHGIVTAKVN
jgi:methyltransferase (TIGR00027 family)